MTLALHSKVGPKGQAVIPKPIRDLLGIRAGDEVSFTLHDGHAHVARLEPQDAEQAWREFFDALPKRRVTPAHIKRDLESQYAQRARRAGSA